jgi:hypothetical protein
MYKLTKDLITGESHSVNKLNPDGSGMCIPFDPANRDYVEYLKWLEDGNTPESADETGE